MTTNELLKLRQMFAEHGEERTPQEIRDSYLWQAEELKEDFRPLAADIKELMGRYELGLLTLHDFSCELERSLEAKVTEEMCKHFMLLAKVFEYN